MAYNEYPYERKIMFKLNKKKDPTTLELARLEVIEAMRQEDPGSDEYARLLDHLKELDAMTLANKPVAATPDTVIKTVGLVLSTVTIVAFETRNVWTTKASPFLMKFI